MKGSAGSGERAMKRRYRLCSVLGCVYGGEASSGQDTTGQTWPLGLSTGVLSVLKSGRRATRLPGQRRRRRSLGPGTARCRPPAARRSSWPRCRRGVQAQRGRRRRRARRQRRPAQPRHHGCARPPWRWPAPPRARSSAPQCRCCGMGKQTQRQMWLNDAFERREGARAPTLQHQPPWTAAVEQSGSTSAARHTCPAPAEWPPAPAPERRHQPAHARRGLGTGGVRLCVAAGGGPSGSRGARRPVFWALDQGRPQRGSRLRLTCALARTARRVWQRGARGAAPHEAREGQRVAIRAAIVVVRADCGASVVSNALVKCARPLMPAAATQCGPWHAGAPNQALILA